VAPTITGFLITGTNNNWTAAFGIAAAICLTGSLSVLFFVRIDRLHTPTQTVPEVHVGQVGSTSGNS
jgi:hypothetical protein